MTQNYHDQAVRMLAQGYSGEFAEYMAGDERVHELMMDLAAEFVETHLPIVTPGDQLDVAAELIMNVTVKKV